MVGKKQILDDIEFSKAFKNLAQAYEEIASSRMQRIRNSVLASRDFLFGINSIFQQVKSSYKGDVRIIMKKKGIKNRDLARFTKHNGKTLFVLLSTNTGLYGEIVQRTFDAFAKELKKAWRSSPEENQTHVAISGRLGVKLFQQDFPKKPYYFFELSDNRMDQTGVKNIIPYLIQYEKIIVFYEQFQNVVTSIPIATSVSGDILPWQNTESDQFKYVFEPSLETVMEYFEKEIIQTIFEQIVFESLLAKFSSRMVALEETSESIEDKLKKLNRKHQIIKHEELNKKQNQTFSSMRMWTAK